MRICFSSFLVHSAHCVPSWHIKPKLRRLRFLEFLLQSCQAWVRFRPRHLRKPSSTDSCPQTRIIFATAAADLWRSGHPSLRCWLNTVLNAGCFNLVIPAYALLPRGATHKLDGDFVDLFFHVVFRRAFSVKAVFPMFCRLSPAINPWASQHEIYHLEPNSAENSAKWFPS